MLYATGYNGEVLGEVKIDDIAVGGWNTLNMSLTKDSCVLVSGSKGATDYDGLLIKIRISLDSSPVVNSGITKSPVSLSPVIKNSRFILNSLIQNSIVSIYDIRGRELLSGSVLKNGFVSIDISHLSAGFYNYRIVSLNGESYSGGFLVR